MTTSVEGSEIVSSLVSPSGKYVVVLRETSESGSSEKKRYIEIWTEDKLQAVENVTDKHGQFYTDGTAGSHINEQMDDLFPLLCVEFLASISFSPSETRVAYVAEQKDGKVNEDNDDPLRKYRFVPELGETFGGRKNPGIFLYEWSREPGKAVLSLEFADLPI